jgi:hypothetical protein
MPRPAKARTADRMDDAMKRLLEILVLLSVIRFVDPDVSL